MDLNESRYLTAKTGKGYSKSEDLQVRSKTLASIGTCLVIGGLPAVAHANEHGETTSDDGLEIDRYTDFNLADKKISLGFEAKNGDGADIYGNVTLDVSEKEISAELVGTKSLKTDDHTASCGVKLFSEYNCRTSAGYLRLGAQPFFETSSDGNLELISIFAYDKHLGPVSGYSVEYSTDNLNILCSGESSQEGTSAKFEYTVAYTSKTGHGTNSYGATLFGHCNQNSTGESWTQGVRPFFKIDNGYQFKISPVFAVNEASELTVGFDVEYKLNDLNINCSAESVNGNFSSELKLTYDFN